MKLGQIPEVCFPSGKPGPILYQSEEKLALKRHLLIEHKLNTSLG